MVKEYRIEVMDAASGIWYHYDVIKNTSDVDVAFDLLKLYSSAHPYRKFRIVERTCSAWKEVSE